MSKPRRGRATAILTLPYHVFTFRHEKAVLYALEPNRMPYIIAEPCIETKDRGCVDVCPVDCIYEGEDQLYIHPDECIDCGACEPECPVTAIFPEEDVPPEWKSYIDKNRVYFESGEERQVARGRGS